MRGIMERVLAILALLFGFMLQATPSHAEDIQPEKLVWAELFDMTRLYLDLPTDTEPEGRVDLRCKLISSDGLLKCRVVRSSLDPDPKGEYSGLVAKIVEQGGRIDMAKTPGASVGKFIIFAVVITISDT
jgi:hypothetical protein